MIYNLIQTLLKNKIWLAFFLILLIGLGIQSLLKVPVDATPDITNVQVVISTKTGGLDPEQVEKIITYNIESEVSGLPKVKEVRSISKFGLSQVSVIFEDKTDIYWARQMVSERLQSVRGNLPEGISPELGPISTGLGEVLIYSVLAKKDSFLDKKNEKEKLLYLRTIQDFVIKPYLKANIENIADVDTLGGYKKEIHIDFSPDKLENYGITLDNIVQKLKTIGSNFGGGYIEKDKKQVIVHTKGQVTLNDLKNLPVKLNHLGQQVKLSEIASVKEDHIQRIGASTYNENESVLGTVLMLLGANGREVALQAEQVLKEVKLPEDVEVKVLYSRSFLVNETISTVSRNLAEGAFLVVLILFLILGNIRAAVIVAIAIPLSMLGAFFGMQKLGISANLMSLGAIDFGLLVDASIIIIENLLRKLQESQQKTYTLSDKISLILESSKEVVRPVTTGLIIIMAVYVPILSLEGIEGKIFQPMAITLLLALGTSLLVALILMPVLGYIFLNTKKIKDKEPLLFRILHKIYLPLLQFSLREKLWNRMILFIPALGALLLGIVIFLRLGSSFMPPLNEGDMVINIFHSSDISLNEVISRQKKVENIILKYPEIKHVFSRIGTAESATDPMGVNIVDTFLILNPEKEWPFAKGKKRTKKQLYDSIAQDLKKLLPDSEVSENQPVQLRFNEILEGSRADISLRIYGKDLNILTELQNQAVEIIEKIPGTKEAELDINTALRKSPSLEINLNYQEMNRYNVNLEEVNHSISTSMAGLEVGMFFDYDWKFPIILKMDEKYRNDIKQISRIPLSLPDSGNIPLGKVASLKEENKVTSIARSKNRRYAGVAISINRDIISYVEEAKEKINQGLKLEPGYELEWGGQFKNMERARNKLMFIIPLTLLSIFFLIYQNFRSVKQSLAIYACIPFSMIGGVFSLYLAGLEFSVNASIGFITLSGLSILNGTVLVTFINQLISKGKDIKDAVMEGSQERLRAVVMTSLVALLGFLPMAVNSGIGSEVQKPLAVVVIGGIVSSTFLTLLLLPSLYLWLENSRLKKK